MQNNTELLCLILEFQSRSLIVQSLLQAEAAKEYKADWLKNTDTVVRDGTGRFAKKGMSIAQPIQDATAILKQGFDLTGDTIQSLIKDPEFRKRAGIAAGLPMAKLISNLAAQVNLNPKLTEKLEEWIARATKEFADQYGDDKNPMAQAIRNANLAQPPKDASFNEKMEFRFAQYAAYKEALESPEDFSKRDEIIGKAASAAIPIGISLAIALGFEVAIPLFMAQGLNWGMILSSVAIGEAADFAVQKGLDKLEINNPAVRIGASMVAGALAGGLVTGASNINLKKYIKENFTVERRIINNHRGLGKKVKASSVFTGLKREPSNQVKSAKINSQDIDDFIEKSDITYLSKDYIFGVHRIDNNGDWVNSDGTVSTFDKTMDAKNFSRFVDDGGADDRIRDFWVDTGKHISFTEKEEFEKVGSLSSKKNENIWGDNYDKDGKYIIPTNSDNTGVSLTKSKESISSEFNGFYSPRVDYQSRPSYNAFTIRTAINISEDDALALKNEKIHRSLHDYVFENWEKVREKLDKDIFTEERGKLYEVNVPEFKKMLKNILEEVHLGKKNAMESVENKVEQDTEDWAKWEAEQKIMEEADRLAKKEIKERREKEAERRAKEYDRAIKEIEEREAKEDIAREQRSKIRDKEMAELEITRQKNKEEAERIAKEVKEREAKAEAERKIVEQKNKEEAERTAKRKAILMEREKLESDPENIKTLLRKANKLKRNDQLQEAIDIYEEISKIDPNHVIALDLKSELLEDLGKTEEKAALGKTIAKINPGKNIRQWHRKAGFLDREGKYEEAIEAYKEILKLDPEEESAKEEVKRLLLKINKKD
jgi:tetratricopeptide (TPR) repeat protein